MAPIQGCEDLVRLPPPPMNRHSLPPLSLHLHLHLHLHLQPNPNQLSNGPTGRMTPEASLNDDG
jgi:hypothetical protein